MAHSKDFSSFSIPEELQNASLVYFLKSDSTACSYYETGIIFKFVKGYTPSQIKKEEKLRKERGIFWEIIEDIERFKRGNVPIRKLDTKDYALVLYFDDFLDNYSMSWVEISKLKTKL